MGKGDGKGWKGLGGRGEGGWEGGRERILAAIKKRPIGLVLDIIISESTHSVAHSIIGIVACQPNSGRKKEFYLLTSTSRFVFGTELCMWRLI